MPAAKVPLCQTTHRRRPRTWHVSPAGFRELRHACLLSRQACAAFLGVGVRTVYHWEAGRCRIPFSAVRLLRFVRLGDLGALCDDWAGWTLNRLGLHDPAGRTYRLDAMRAWWITCEQAQFWREGRPSLLGASTVPSGSRGRCAAPVSGSTPPRGFLGAKKSHP